jgi:hypothetical protein
VHNIESHEPAAAWTWALSIGDPSMRLKSLQEAAVSLHGRDASSARQLVQSAELTPDEKAALLKIVSQSASTPGERQR